MNDTTYTTIFSSKIVLRTKLLQNDANLFKFIRELDHKVDTKVPQKYSVFLLGTIKSKVIYGDLNITPKPINPF